MTQEEAIARAVVMKKRGLSYEAISVAFAVLTDEAYGVYWWKRQLRGRVPRQPRGRSFEAQWVERAKRTHCVNGHPYTPENTRVRPDGARVCRACHRALSAARRAA